MYYTDDIHYFDKNKIVILQNWCKEKHGSTGYNTYDNYFKTKNLVITTFNDDYDVASDDNIISFLDYWSERITQYRFAGWVDFNNPNFNITPWIALADTYIYKDYCFAIDKTYLIIRIQRKWRSYYNKLKDKIRIAKQIRSIIYRETYGKFPVC